MSFNPLDWLIDLWDYWRRMIDIAMIWPVCVDNARSDNHARNAFLLHAMNDSAWTRHFTDTELVDMINSWRVS